MDRPKCLDLFEQLTTWGRGGERAPHKPLLVLYALGRWAQGQAVLPFHEACDPLAQLLRDFGPPRRSYRVQDPFWRLQNDDIWEVRCSTAPVVGADGAPSKPELLRVDARGQFTEELQRLFRTDPVLIGQIAQQLLDSHFPSSLHEDILEAVGLDLDAGRATGGGRDPNFRRLVLVAYEHRCAVCGLQLILSGTPIALEAAHIKWHQASGPAIIQNGLSLCVLHHKVFDLGAFTVSPNLRVLVSEEASGLCGFNEHLLVFHGRELLRPIRPDSLPSAGFIDWHRHEVFRGNARPLE